MDPFSKLSKDELFEVAIRMPPPSLVNFCASNPKFEVICNSKEFWRRKLEKDYAEEMKGIGPINFPKYVYMKRFESISRKIERFIPEMILIVFGDMAEYLKPEYKTDLYNSLYNLYQDVSQNWDEIIKNGDKLDFDATAVELFYNTLTSDFFPNNNNNTSLEAYVVELMREFSKQQKIPDILRNRNLF